MKIIFSYKNVIVLALIFRSPIHVELTFGGGNETFILMHVAIYLFPIFIP